MSGQDYLHFEVDIAYCPLGCRQIKSQLHREAVRHAENQNAFQARHLMPHKTSLSAQNVKIPCLMQLRRMKVKMVPSALLVIALLPILVLINQKRSMEGVSSLS